MRHIGLIIASVLLSAAAAAQSPAPARAPAPTAKSANTPPSPAPSLEETEKFITAKVDSSSSVYYSFSYQSPHYGNVGRLNYSLKSLLYFSSYQLSNSTIYSDSKIPKQHDNINLKDVSSIDVESLNSIIQKSGVIIVQPVTPNVFTVKINDDILARIDESTGNIIDNGGFSLIYFYDHDIALRVAKAMAHAVVLCGGGKKEPF